MITSEFPKAISEAIVENSLRAVQQLGFVQEQNEKFGKMVLENSRISREEGVKFAQRWAEQVRENQKHVQALVHNTVRMSLDSYKTASQQTIEELTRQVEHLTRQVETLTAAAKVKA